MFIPNVVQMFLFSVYFKILSFFDNSSTLHLRRSLIAYPLSSTPIWAPFTTVVNGKATLNDFFKAKLIKDFKERVELDGIAFFQSQRKRTDSAVKLNVIKSSNSTTKTLNVKQDPTIAISEYYKPTVVKSATCTSADGTGYNCIPNKYKWNENPGNFAFLYYNSMEECKANGQPFYFYSEMQTSCVAGIRQSCNKHTKSVTVKSYDNMDCTGSVRSKYSYQISTTSYPSSADFTLCHDSPYSAGIVKSVCVGLDESNGVKVKE